jgi:hypothetical protein
VQLPFTREQVFDLFAASNAALWPALVVLWIASAVVSLLLLSSRRPPDRWISALMPHTGSGPRWPTMPCSSRASTRLHGFSQRCSSSTPLFSSGSESCCGACRSLPGATHGRRGVAARGVSDDLHGRLANARNGSLVAPVDRSVIWSEIGGSTAFFLGVRADYVLPIAGLALAILTVQRSQRRRHARQTIRRTSESGLDGRIPGARPSAGRPLSVFP